MTKRIFLSILCLTIIGLTLNSCQKENNTNSAQDKIAEYNNLTKDYLNQINENGVQSKPRWMKILGADLKGALTGAGVGAGAGALIAGVGAGAGAVVGGIVGGAAGSLEAGYETASKKSDYNPSQNGNNPYDYIGLYHCGSINSALDNINNYSENGAFSVIRFYNFSKNYLIANNLNVPSNTYSSFTANECQGVLNIVISDSANSLTEFLTTYNNSYLTTTVKTVLNDYFIALQNTQSVTAFVTYSITAENLIVSSSLSSMDKQIILGTMSTARYGIQYWGMN